MAIHRYLFALLAASSITHGDEERIFKTLKFNMAGGETVLEKFQNAQKAGFEGIELNVPNAPVKEAMAAAQETGLTIDGSVCNSHWQIRHSDPDPAIRKQALDDLLKGIRETHAAGGSTILLVAGHGKDGTPEEVWKRSYENIRQALPLAARLGITIAIENVWNSFLYEHDGPADQTADELARYIDAFNSPFIGVQFDIGNHWKYGDPAQWIRTLGKRIVKLDLKGFSREHNKFTHIGAGDIDFTSVRQALVDINFYGWCAAEVAGGNLERLRDISSNMDQALLTK